MADASTPTTQTFETFIEKERARLDKEREDITAKRAALDEQLTKIDQELQAISAYEAAKHGKPVQITTPKQTGTRRPRRSGVRDAVLQTIHQHPDGINRAQLLDIHDAKGNKSAEQSISNALAALKKAGAINLNDGVYTVTEAPQ